VLSKFLFFGILAYVLVSFDNIQTIVAGIAIFIVGMFFMEDGFKNFAGGTMQNILRNWTNSTPKAITTGFIATTAVQSSSLLSLIIISFLSTGILTLNQAIGVIFGSNIGSTTTAWIVSLLGVKIDIAHYAMMIIVFGVASKFVKGKTAQGVGDALLGIGFVFLGIDLMKDGFDSMKDGINLAEYHINGLLGIITYVIVGIIITIVIQSSAATMTLVIVAISSNQIAYIDGVALAIGANIGTTLTAVIGAIGSNANGKKLALVHFTFNVVTAIILIILIQPMVALIDLIAPLIGIATTDLAMKLSLFHTVFNITGVLILSPFIPFFVKILEKTFIDPKLKSGEPKYLNMESIETSVTSITAIKKESEHLYHNSLEIIVHGLSLHNKDIFSEKAIKQIIAESQKPVDIDIDRMYQVTVKNLYGEIIKFSSLAQEKMTVIDIKYIYSLKIVNRGMVRAIKDIEKIQDNINSFIHHENNYIRHEYNLLREKMIKIFRELRKIEESQNFTDSLLSLEMLKKEMADIDTIANGRLDRMIREGQIDTKMATSLINDSMYIYNVANRLLEFAETVWADNEILREYNNN
jgi:phosphate:Na+ symporter